jgi:hypothetical protein
VNGHTFACELRSVAEDGWETILSLDGTIYACRRFLLHGEACEFADDLWHDIAASSCTPCRGLGWVCEEHPEKRRPHDDCAGPVCHVLSAAPAIRQSARQTV